MITADKFYEPASSNGEKTIPVTPNRMKRMALSLMLPGGVSDRSAETCLKVAFDEGRSPAYLSALAHESGKRAYEILQKIDHSVMGTVILARDKIFVGRDRILLVVEPHSQVITGLYATVCRDAETWGCVLLFTKDRRVRIKGLSEDGCIPYATSGKLAKMDLAIQKDVWHPLEVTHKTLKDVEREAYQKLKLAEILKKQLRKQWDETVFAKWVVLNE